MPVLRRSHDRHRRAKTRSIVGCEIGEGSCCRLSRALVPGFDRYGESKPANLLFTRELARRLEGSSGRNSAEFMRELDL
jgi:hypothetical protein